MKKYLITGLVILLPLALTIILVSFVFNLLTAPFAWVVESILNYFGIFQSNFFFLSANDMKQLVSKLAILLFLFIFTIILGALARWYFFNSLIKIWDYVLHRIPFIRSIYKICQDVIKTIFASDTKSFKQVVLVPFPKADSYSIGFVTRDDLPSLTQTDGKNLLVAVFIPTTPNPTSGFLIAYEEKDLTYLDMAVEDAFKCIISSGTLLSGFRKVSKEEALAMIEARQKSTKTKKITAADHKEI